MMYNWSQVRVAPSTAIFFILYLFAYSSEVIYGGGELKACVNYERTQILRSIYEGKAVYLFESSIEILNLCFQFLQLDVASFS